MKKHIGTIVYVCAVVALGLLSLAFVLISIDVISASASSGHPSSGAGIVMSGREEELIPKPADYIDVSNVVSSMPDSAIMGETTLAECVEEQVMIQKESAAEAEKKRQERLEREAAERAEQERLAQIDSITANPDNVTELSNLTEEQFYILTKGTWWAGNEWVLMEIEKQYHINAMFVMSVSTLESGCGTTWRARTKNNFYGAEVPRYFEDIYENSMYFGDFLNRLYINEGLISVWAIGPKYCPPNRNWEVYMYDKMNELKNKVVSTVR